MDSLISDISLQPLAEISFNKYVNRLTDSVKLLVKHDSHNLLVVIQAIKHCPKPCYKRDVLLEILKRVVFSKDEFIQTLLCNIFPTECNRPSWKELANSIASLPDLVANCHALDRYSDFEANHFFKFILIKLYSALESLATSKAASDLEIEEKFFYIQLIGRISITGYHEIVWSCFSSRLLREKREKFRDLAAHIMILPTQADPQAASQFEIFIEPLYSPIFYNLRPSSDSGKIIASILGGSVTNNEHFEYMLCSKFIFQKNYTLNIFRQLVILFNIFAYLSYLNSSKNKERLRHPEPSILIKTLLEIAKSWSNGTKIVLRTYEHNRYICNAFVIAFRYALESDRGGLIDRASEIHSRIVQGFPSYMNRASASLRNLAMCLGEILLSRLNEIIEFKVSDNSQARELPPELKFDLEWNDDCLNMKRLIDADLEQIFKDFNTSKASDNLPFSDGDVSLSKGLCLEPERCSSKSERSPPLAKKLVTDLVDDDDDLEPYEMDEEDGCQSDTDEVGDSYKRVPIYLSDCINGLVENNKPRYVKICLIKADELISQLSKQGTDSDKTLSLMDARNRPSANRNEPYVSDSIRDSAIELARILLYLDDQFGIDNFDSYRYKALCSLSVAAPDLVVKYLLDEFNGTNRNTRHQLDILQVLVASAQQLAGVQSEASSHRKGGGTNKFARYAPLYFYGVSQQLKAMLSSSLEPTTIVSAAKSLANSSFGVDSKRETIIKRVIGGIVDSRTHLGGLENANFGPILARPASESQLKLLNSRPAVIEETETVHHETRPDDPRINASLESGRARLSSSSSTSRPVDDGRRLKESDCQELDDSYLLSRIFLSISLIFKCLNQQPITCKLSTDLLDILAAYKGHPDSGVRRAIVGCLKEIRDCTPSVYFEEHLYDKTMRLFGPWLAHESELISHLRPRSGR